MTEQIVQCPHCANEVKVEVDMYIDSGDVCYDVFVNQEQATENEDLTSPTRYKCLACKKHFQIKLDENHWGSEDIPLTLELT